MKKNCLSTFLILLFVLTGFCVLRAQSRVQLNNQAIFCSGANVGWISFARDLGPGTSTNSFKDYFRQFSEAGGNTVRVWLHTTGQNTPIFDANGNVTGPGPIAVSNLKALLDAAWEHKIGLMLCLWSFDMQRKTIGAATLANTRKLLMDSTATRTYINNALTPLVEAVKGHPALLCWEIFNEPEGMSVEFGWSSITTCEIPMLNIQRFVNKLTGAIHRIDPNAKVTNGTWSFYAATDMNYLSKEAPVDLRKLSADEQEKIKAQIAAKYNVNLSIDEIQKNFIDKTALLANINYYRDDRLIQAGGDQKGTLDFYCVHYYASNFGTGYSPFHHPYNDWGLDKSLVVAEFYPEDSHGVLYQQLYKKLIETGYAGAMTWGWDNQTFNSRTRELMAGLYSAYPYDVVIAPKSGTVFSFSASPATIEKGETSTIEWKTAVGSKVIFEDQQVEYKGSKNVSLMSTNTFIISAEGEVKSNKTLLIQVIPSGRIFSFRASNTKIGAGESVTLSWQTSKMSTVKLNGQPVTEDGSLLVIPTATTTEYKLVTNGDIPDSSTVTINIIDAAMVNRAMNKTITASSNAVDAISANDGSYFSFWSSQNSDNQWIEIDLGGIYDVNRIDIYWDTNDYAKTYRVGHSIDKLNYKIIKTVSTNLGGYVRYPNLSETGRYFRFVLDKRSGTAGFKIWEIEIFGKPTPVDIAEHNSIPLEFKLNQNYPNPFNPETVISYQLPVAGYVTLKVYDVLGNEIATLVDEFKQPGVYNSQFSILNYQLTSGVSAKGGCASGVYFYKLTAGNFTAVKKMILIK